MRKKILYLFEVKHIIMKKLPSVKALTRSLRNKTILERAGISARAYITPSTTHTIAIFPDMLQANTFIQDYTTLYPDRPAYLVNELPLTSETEGLNALLLERGEIFLRWRDSKGVLAASPGALMSSCLVGGTELTISLSDKFDINRVTEWLILSGYKRSNLVWSPGQYVQRGFILDVYDPAYTLPLRFEFIDDALERIGGFLPDTQKSSPDLMAIDTITLHGMSQAVSKSVLELLPDDTMIIINDPEKTETQADAFMWLWREIFIDARAGYNVEAWSRLFPELAQYPVIRITTDPAKSDGELLTDTFPAFKGDSDVILRLCDQLKANGFSIDIFTNNPVFQKLPYTVHEGVLSSGFVDRNTKQAFISDRELSGVSANIAITHRRAPTDWNDGGRLSPGQLVVHEDYGTGIFRGIETINDSGVPLDVLSIEFAEDQRLLIPVLQSDKITGLNEHESEAVKLDTLRGKSWKKNYLKTRERAQEEARVLMELFAKRELERREPFDANGEMYDDFVRAFTFNETADQLKAIDEIMKDLSGKFPMDRLLVGDVGFGKTEVAMRAAFRVVMSGYQVCVLVPTTILAQQHYATFQSRFSGFPVKVGLLSRFVTSKQAKETIASVSEGKVDILIGTHKLLQKGVKFHKLGMLVIDEEHRFGVMHKESLKLTYGSVDILSLSATPIPRTLAMSLRGLRSISVLSTPPEDRLPVTTYTGTFSPSTIRRAITYELNRGGQVYFLSNKISRMPEYLKMLEAFFPEANIRTAHGQMPEKELEATMMDFYSGKADILLATTIIESGLDVGRANTIIIDNSEELGLAQMYQLRGRVGRRGEKAFAYFFYPDKAALNQDTLERIEAIATMTELGSGYEIARRDLDIRGGGEIGGTHQHGNVKNGNYNIFYRLLEDELNKLRGGEKRKIVTVVSDRGNGYIPSDYIPQDDVRITVYRRLLNALGLDELAAIVNEIRDRFGTLPNEVKYLVGLMAVKNFGVNYGFQSVTIKKGLVIVKHEGENIPAFMKEYVRSLGRNVKYC